MPEPSSTKISQVYKDARRQATRLSRSRSKSNTSRPAATKGPRTNSKKSLGATKTKLTSIENREAMFNATNITLDNYDIKQTENQQSAKKKEVSLPKYHPGRQTLKSTSSRGKSLGAGDRRSKGRNSTCSLESHNSNGSKPRYTVQPVRTRSRDKIRIYDEENQSQTFQSGCKESLGRKIMSPLRSSLKTSP